MVFSEFGPLLRVGTVALLTGFMPANGSEISGQSSNGEVGVHRTTAEIMADPAALQPRNVIYLKREHEIPGREGRAQDGNAPLAAHWPLVSHIVSDVVATPSAVTPLAAQSVTTKFDGVSGPSQTGSFPPDSMGAVGPSQFVIFVNGRLRTFNKGTGTADNVLNIDPDVFFSSVATPVSGGGVNFTTDPQIRYDRLSGRWILVIIDVPSSSSNSIGDLPNRVLIAVSDAASAGVISANTVWSYYFIQQNTVGGGNTGEFLDYESLGVDNNALYIGGNMFGAASGSFVTTSGFVVRKSSVLNGGPIFVTAFRGLIGGGDGLDSPRGVDDYDTAATEGYFIGDSDAAFGRLVLRRVSNPGGTPTISSNLAVTVNSTAQPIQVDHLGNTNGANGRLDGLDTRLFVAQIRNGRLWTAHNIAVSATGVASSSDSQRRNAARWYELNVPVGAGSPTLVQSGTVFDSTSILASARNYWIPSVAISGQGHAALGFSTAGAAFRVDAATSGRLLGDTLGTMSAPALFTSSTTSYNPTGDSGNNNGARRWGDYSFTTVDPDDDMTMWTIQEFCDGINSYGLEVAKLVAPPPATPASTSSSVTTGQSSVSVTITGSPIAGSGFFEPGPSFAKHLTATVSGGVVVNSATFTDSTHVTLNLKTVGASAGAQTVTITNPDGQSRNGSGILTVTSTGPTPTPTASPTPTATPTPTVTPTPTATPTPTPTATPTQTVATPVITPMGGTFRRKAGITISDATAGTTIRFTLDGSTPTTTSTVYTREFVLTQSASLHAKAFKTGSNPSAAAAATFVIKRK